jgi:hypothetical protein
MATLEARAMATLKVKFRPISSHEMSPSFRLGVVLKGVSVNWSRSWSPPTVVTVLMADGATPSVELRTAVVALTGVTARDSDVLVVTAGANVTVTTALGVGKTRRHITRRVTQKIIVVSEREAR